MQKEEDQQLFEKSIRFLGKSLGATELSFSNIEVLTAEKRMGYSRCITIFIRLSQGVLDQIKYEPTQTYFSHYRTVNRLIDDITLRLSLFLEDRGYPSLAIPASQSVADPNDAFTGAFQHKTGAVLSGEGWIGRSALFIHRNYGPRVRLGTVLTNAPLTVGVPTTRSECGTCRACVTACPAMAIEGQLWELGLPRNALYDAYSCSQHMKDAYKHIGRGAVCGLCMVACPVGKE
ncbi:4Fe-4S double cluster binding domain-containing protein [Acetobacterium bakii]|uniref:4Fe-4S ferredoxin n=1 Tax=Acetobacterium bakii TaxID=52689 RepID=A0A0L6TZI2_9FIRM|nr:4Fe-4S double cluster binding domain-containing protein [Acetobacterium bakii]KNZ41679.1 4Fe-4S ferredoxin [Acetobacterium bakii]